MVSISKIVLPVGLMRKNVSRDCRDIVCIREMELTHGIFELLFLPGVKFLDGAMCTILSSRAQTFLEQHFFD